VEIDGILQASPLIGCNIDKPSKAATVFLDIDFELGLGNFAGQALVLTGQRLNASRRVQRGVDLVTTLLRFQYRLFSCG